MVDPLAPTERPPTDLAARMRVLEAANAALCEVICESAPLAWVARGDADAAHRWEKRALALVKSAQQFNADATSIGGITPGPRR